MEKSEGKNIEYMEGMDFINSYLEEDEYVLWRGKPGKKNRFSSIDKVMFPFALFWTAFALLLEGSVIMSEAPLIYCVFGVPFVLIGIFLLYSSFFSNVFAKGKTSYVVTNKKLMIKVDNDIEIYMPDELPPMKIKLYKMVMERLFLAGKRIVGGRVLTILVVCWKICRMLHRHRMLLI